MIGDFRPQGGRVGVPRSSPLSIRTVRTDPLLGAAESAVHTVCRKGPTPRTELHAMGCVPSRAGPHGGRQGASLVCGAVRGGGRYSCRCRLAPSGGWPVWPDARTGSLSCWPLTLVIPPVPIPGSHGDDIFEPPAASTPQLPHQQLVRFESPVWATPPLVGLFHLRVVGTPPSWSPGSIGLMFLRNCGLAVWPRPGGARRLLRAAAHPASSLRQAPYTGRRATATAVCTTGPSPLLPPQVRAVAGQRAFRGCGQ